MSNTSAWQMRHSMPGRPAMPAGRSRRRARRHVMAKAPAGELAARARALGLGVAIVLAALLAHGPAIPGDFLWDDNYWITDNPVLAAGQAPAGYWWTSRTYDYLPVTATFFYLQRQLWGDRPEYDPRLPYPALPYRAVNVALHAAGAVLVWRVLAVLAVPGAWLGALLFAVHPVTVASAGWVAETKNTLSLVFCALALLAYLRFDATGRWRLYAWSLLAFALALLSKTSTVVLPPMLAVLLWWRHRPLWTRRTAPTLAAFFLLAAAAGAVTLWLHRHVAVGGLDVQPPHGAAQRLLTAAKALWFYAASAVAPVRLRMVYPKWDPAAVDWTAAAAPALLAWFAVLAACRRRAWARPAAAVTACFALALAPVLGLLDMSFMRFSFVSDHLAYLALPAVTATAGAAAALLARRGPRWRRGVTACAAAAVVLLAVATAGRAHTFALGHRLWSDAVRRDSGAWLPRCMLGLTLINEGRSEQAIEHLLVAYQLKSDYPPVAINLGAAYANIGAVHAEGGRHAQAVECYNQAIRYYDQAPEFRCMLAASLFELDKPAEAMGQLEQALALARQQGRPDMIAEIQALIEYHGRRGSDPGPGQPQP